MALHSLVEAYHVERAIAVEEGIDRYPCACEKCHGFKIQATRVVESHHQKYGRDRNLRTSVLHNSVGEAPHAEDSPADLEEANSDEEFVDAEDYENFEPAPMNTNVHLDDMAQDFFGRVDEIHEGVTDEEDSILNFSDLSGEDEGPDESDLMEDLLLQAEEPLFEGSRTSRLQFCIILMSLCTLFSVSHHCLDEILTFLKYDVLPVDNTCPKNSYELKAMLGKLGLSHEMIHCCDCGKTLYWKENAELDKCPKCQKSRYIQGSNSVPIRVLRYFSLIKRLRRMFRCPELSKHMQWHSRNHSTDGKMRSVVDSDQWRHIDDNYPEFARDPRNVRIGLSLDGVNPHSLQSSKHSVWPVMLVFYNLPPYLVTKRFFISLSMIIPGPKSPSEDTIDVYLQPLVHELKKLWVGVPAIDRSRPADGNQRFTLKGMLMWTINDYPAYTLISGQAGKGYAGCPVCGEGTLAEHSAEADKILFLGNRRWLKENHCWRNARAAFNGNVNHDPAPPRQCGLTVVQRGAWRESYLQCGGRRNGEHDPVKVTGVKRISILFQLPYWEKLPVRHLLDPMHCETNVCENLVRTFLGETDGVKSREDLRSRGIRRHLQLQPNPDGVTFFMPDAPYVLKREEREEFLKTLGEIKFPTNYVGSLKQRLEDGKLSGLKTHDFHILMQQVLPVCLRNIGTPTVIAAVMRVSRLFKRICAKVVDLQEKQKMLEDVAETICALEKEFPPSIFVVMMHLPIHLVEELFICGPVHTRWMYPFERYMKGLKSFVKNKAKPEGSMAYGYLREEAIGFLNEYLAEYTPTRKRVWDDNEEPTVYDEVLKGQRRNRPMSEEFRKLIHSFVLDNTEHMEPYRSQYEDAVKSRTLERDTYRREHRRRGRRSVFSYPAHLQLLPDFAQWTLEEVRRQEQAGVVVDPDVIDTARGPLQMATAYKSMYAFGNHFRVISAERSLKTADSGVAATFRQVCRNGIHDVNQVDADVEYVGHIEEILELNYRRHCVIVFVCDFVKANYRGENATIKKDKWGFTLANYDKRPGIICRDSFAFPKHCEQVFYVNAMEAPGWKIVLRKEVRSRRILPEMEEELNAPMFTVGNDEDYEGLRPETNLREEDEVAIEIGHDVLLQKVFVPGRHRSVRGRGGRGRRPSRSARRGLRVPHQQRGCGDRAAVHGLRQRGTRNYRQETVVEEQNDLVEQEDLHEEEFLYAENLGRNRRVRRRNTEDDNGGDRRRIRRQVQASDIEVTEGYGNDLRDCSQTTSGDAVSLSTSGDENNLL